MPNSTKKHSPAGNQRKGWAVVDMKKDWKVIYPFEMKYRVSDIRLRMVDIFTVCMDSI